MLTNDQNGQTAQKVKRDLKRQNLLQSAENSLEVIFVTKHQTKKLSQKKLIFIKVVQKRLKSIKFAQKRQIQPNNTKTKNWSKTSKTAKS